MAICREHPSALNDGTCSGCLRQKLANAHAALEGMLRSLSKNRPDGPYPVNDVLHRMQDVARVVEMVLPESCSFFVFAGDIGEGPERRANYVATMRREDALNSMREFLIKNGDDPKLWAKHTI
jgi:hypothetical protein